MSVRGPTRSSAGLKWSRWPGPLHDNPDFVSIVLRGIGEMLGVKDNGTPDPNISWIDLSPEHDEFGLRRAYVHLRTTPPDDELWDEMDEAMFQIAKKLGSGELRVLGWRGLEEGATSPRKAQERRWNPRPAGNHVS